MKCLEKLYAKSILMVKNLYCDHELRKKKFILLDREKKKLLLGISQRVLVPDYDNTKHLG